MVSPIVQKLRELFVNPEVVTSTTQHNRAARRRMEAEARNHCELAQRKPRGWRKALRQRRKEARQAKKR